MHIPKQAYLYQKRMAELLLADRKSVILQAPTGAGKTHAALLPYLNAVEHNRDFPRKCIYSVPMRVLANQFVGAYKDAVKRADREEYIKVSIQTGEQPEDSEFAKDLIFATIDQTLSSFLIAPYSLSRRKANLNAGAVASAYLVFDEFHLFDPASTLPTTLAMLHMLRDVTPFVLMTATFSQTMLEELAHKLNAVVVPGNEAERSELLKLETQQKTRRYHVANVPLSAQAVLDKHCGRSLAICNTVGRAMQLYDELRRLAQPHINVILLHSRFLPAHRGKKEDLLRQQFGRGAEGGDYIVVATQAIEVGVDITSTVLHTELAPANAIIQRAGRCARYKDDEGDVYIYERSVAPTGEEISLLEKRHPYASKAEEAQFHLTLAQFRERGGSKALNFKDEQAILTAVHSKRDAEIIQQIGMREYDHKRNMYSVMRGDDLANVGDVVRNVISQSVTIHANPDDLRQAPFDVPAFNLHPGSVQKYITDWLKLQQEADDAPDWAVQYLVEHKLDKRDADFESAAQFNEERFEFNAVRHHAKEAWGAKLIVVHPYFATYDQDLGFVPFRGERVAWQAELPQDQTGEKRSGQSYRLETYAEHIHEVYQAFSELWGESAYAARRLEAEHGWTPGSVRRAAELAVLLHDVGKLSVGWQSWVRGYQKRIGKSSDPNEAYAHTDYDSTNPDHVAAQRAQGKRPWHAVESALTVEPWLWELLNEPILVKAVYSAIARHHSPYSIDNQAYLLGKEAYQKVMTILKQYKYSHVVASLIFTGVDREDLQGVNVIQLNDDPNEDEITCFLLYLVLVRVLRRADQLGTRRGSSGV